MKKAAVAIVSAAAFGLAACSEPKSADVAFDATAWREGAAAAMSTRAPRLRIADQLLKSRVLVGKTRAEVMSMLGRPAETSKFDEYDLVYWLGAERSYISIDSEWLAIGFDRAGVVADVRIVAD